MSVVLGAGDTTLGAAVGGVIVRAAAIAAAAGVPVVMASEAGMDGPGDIAVQYLAGAGVDTHCIDRFTEGHTPLEVYAGDASTLTRYEQYPDECFDIIWPRIDEGDIIVFGGHYVLDTRMRPRIQRLLTYAAGRKAVAVYVPDFRPALQPRITRVMPEILDSLETADIVIASGVDVRNIFGLDSAAQCFAERVSFYSRSMVGMDCGGDGIGYFCDGGTVVFPAGDARPDCMMWRAGAVAGALCALAGAGATPEMLRMPPEALRKDVVKAMADAGAAATAGVPEWMLTM